jgi:hypothetical protein
LSHYALWSDAQTLHRAQRHTSDVTEDLSLSDHLGISTCKAHQPVDGSATLQKSQ